ncbi:hypothetical protein [Mycolicibacterium mucogenicum]|nr:hypothetical protein [Mycolicibacterium mucogenicum]
MTREDLVLAMRTSLTDGGWPPEWAEVIADENLAMAAAFDTGTVIERRLEEFWPRTA